MKTIKQSIITIIVCLVILTGVNLVYAWTGPTQAPPGGNVAAPINISSVSQYKAGALSIGGLLQTAAFQLTTGAGAGKVLTSDVSGLASWQIGGGGSGVTSVTGNNGVTASPTTGAVGVSLTNPTKSCGAGFAIQSFDLRNSNAPGCVAVGGAGGLSCSGSCSANYLSKWVSATQLTNSQIYDNGSNVGIGTAAPAAKLDVQNGSARIGANLSANNLSTTLPNSWNGIHTNDLHARWSVRTNTLCLGGGGGGDALGDCRSVWPSGGSMGAIDCTIVTASAPTGAGGSATCPADRKLTGGGCRQNDISYRYAYMYPNASNGWTCGGEGGGTSSVGTAYAVCCKVQ